MFKFSIDNYQSNKLGQTGDLTCTNGLLRGLNANLDKNNSLIIESANCGAMKLDDDIYNLKKGEKLSNLCDCEPVVGNERTISCPEGKFLSNYNPVTKKGTCCKICSPDQSAKTSYVLKDCSTIYKNRDEKDQSCPPSTFLKSVTMSAANTKLECCRPKLEGKIVEEAKKELGECDDFGISKDKCNINEVNSFKDRCKEYGIPYCNKNAMKGIEDKCDKYGLRYFDSDENKYKNTDSYVMCHNDNMAKLDAYCREHNISPCNFYQMRDKPIKDLQGDIININAIDNAFENKLGILPSTTVTRVLSGLCVVAFILIIAAIIYLYRK